MENALISPERMEIPDQIVDFILAFRETRCKQYATDVLSCLDEAEVLNVEASIQRAMSVLATLHLPVQEHFIPIYREREGRAFKDWKLSNMACVYTVLNANPNKPQVAEFQAKLVRRMGGVA